MKSVGEAMSMGRNMKESLQKAIRSMEYGRYGLGADGKQEIDPNDIDHEINSKAPQADRLFYVKAALENGWSIDKLYKVSGIDPWFLNQINDLVQFEKEEFAGKKLQDISPEVLRQAKEWGYSDTQIAWLTGSNYKIVENLRKEICLTPVYKTVDTCAAEFRAQTPYHYSTYDSENEAVRTDRKKVIILGGGPNRIGQGIEFDYCCVHASYALQEEGYEAIMVNSNPETVSTDYDTSDKLYFEPLTREDVFAILDQEKPDGVILQFGGQTPLKLANALEDYGATVIGTSPKSIDLAEDRELFSDLVNRLGLLQPENGLATNLEEAITAAKKIGYPVLVRPSFVLGGRAMMIVYNEEELTRYMDEAVEASDEKPVLVDRFLQDAIEVDVDCISDGTTTVVAGIMQHIEPAGIHSGDSACVLPPYSLSDEILEELKRQGKLLAKELKVIGLMNIQFAIKGNDVYLIEVNPRASRTVPFVSKAIGVPLAKLATKIMIGKTLQELGFAEAVQPKQISVKESVFPFNKFPGVDTVLSPEMKSTGEVMGIDDDFGMAFAKAQLAAGSALPKKGNVFISVNDIDKASIAPLAKKLSDVGFGIFATTGTANIILEEGGVSCTLVNKVSKSEPNVISLLSEKKVDLLINTPMGKMSAVDDTHIRKTALRNRIPYTTTMAAAVAAVEAIVSMQTKEMTVTSIQDHHNA
jgi:carbamoyl-phosphate synthase large subunit